MVAVPIIFDIGPNDGVMVSSQVSFNSEFDAGVDLQMCLQSASGGIIPLPGGLQGQRTTAPGTDVWGFSAVIAPGSVAPGQYNIGLCATTGASGAVFNIGSNTSGILFTG